MIRSLSILITSLLALFANAQIDAVAPIQRNVDILKQEGRLVSVQLVRGQPLKIIITGREAARVDLNQMKVLVRRTQSGSEKNITVQKVGDAYLVTEPVENSDLEIKAELKGKAETFRFQLKEKKP